MKFRLCLSLSLILFVVMPVFAQSEARHEASAGYSFLGPGERHGWVSSFTEKMGNRLGIEAEVAGNYRKTTFFGSQNDFVHSILAGPQFKLRQDAKLVPWAHALAGITLNNVGRLTFVATPSGGSTLAVIRTTDVRFGLQPGVGIDYWVKPKLGIRFGTDYRREVGKFSDRDFFRIQGGVVVRLGEN